MGVSGREKDRHDHYFKKARSEQYRARSVYKLQEIQQRFKLLRRGATVIDLGAAPGSWTQLAAELVGAEGRVIAVDRTAILGGLPAQVKTLQLDLLEVSPTLLQEQAGVSNVDVVLSDMAPNTSGVRGVDHVRSVELCRVALLVCDAVLKAQGWLVVKIFQGPDLHPFVQELKARFEDVRHVKPHSSREESVELFLVAKGFDGRQAGDVRPPPTAPAWDPTMDG